MALIINIDTTSEVCSVCLSDSGVVIAEINDLSPNQHASMLTTFISELLRNQNVRIADLDAIALSAGPGSYTGLRIGASVAKGLCYGLDIPLIAVSTLQGIACHMADVRPDMDGIYVAMLDARRDDVYIAIYSRENELIKKDMFMTVSSELNVILSSYNVKNIYFGGPGSHKVDLSCLNIKFGIVIENIICVASNINSISYNRFIGKAFDDLDYYEPFYLKEFEGRMKSS